MGKRKIATAIGYSSEDPAPALFATGRDGLAERIIAVAEEAGVTVVEDEALAVLLDSWAFGTNVTSPRVKPGDFIPLWCWEAAAKILAFVMKEEQRKT
jgi:type III secretion system FlhB-like substrate exporter